MKKVITKEENLINLPNIKKELTELYNLDNKIADLVSKRETMYSFVYNVAKESMIELYNSNKCFPGTITVVSGNMNFKFITSDNYKKIDKDRFNELVDLYGSQVVEEQTIISFNNYILLKHKEHISKLIMGSKQLSKEEKANLFVKETFYSVRKGIIKDLLSIVKSKVNAIIEDIQPIFSIKSLQKNT